MLIKAVGKGQWAEFIAAIMDDAELLAQLRRADGEH